MIQFFGYDKCSTCRKAKAHLTKLGIKFESIDIVTAPPSRKLLAAILKAGDYTLPLLFNRSGELYREMKIKDKLPKLSEAAALDLLAQHGKLVKRPIVSDGKKFTVGYDEQTFAKVWS